MEPDLSIPGHPDVFAIGDLAHFTGPDGPLPGLAPVAEQQGEWAVRNILRTIEGPERVALHHQDKGSMATIGRGAAVAEIGGWKFDG